MDSVNFAIPVSIRFAGAFANQLLYTIISTTINTEKLTNFVSTASQKAYRGNGLMYLQLLTVQQIGSRWSDTTDVEKAEDPE